MQDPRAGVDAALKGHLHLLSAHSYPLVAQLQPEQAFRYLIEAPSVVKQVAPMSWQYVTPPQDGTMWLEWFPQTQNGPRYPSDGYAYGDSEMTFHHNYNGYTMELLVHNMGFRPGHDHMTSHARTRYHFISKAPHINAANPEPSLWIVHYHQTPQQRIVPTQQVQVDQYTREVMAQRAALESQGRIERIDFMLHDREHWPTITLPGSQSMQMQDPNFYGNPMHNRQMHLGAGRYMQPPYPQQHGPPSAKRPRIQGPGPITAPEVSGPELGVDDEDNIALGDYFDHLTPREISLARYQQHHQWMGEVLSAPYPSEKLVPTDLGLGLMGELKGLTDGILPPPTTDIFLNKPSADSNEDENFQSANFTSLSKDQLDEFNARVQKHIDAGKSEIERMKADHAVKMRGWRKAYKLTQAERQLRTATWKGHESAIFRTTEPEAEQAIQVESIVESVEKLVGQSIKAHAATARIEKGGLIEIEQRQPDVGLAVHSQQQSTALSTAPSEAVSFQPDRTTSDHQANATGMSGHPQSTQATINTAAGRSADTIQQTSAMVSQDTANTDILNDGMDIDAADLQFGLDDTPGQGLEQIGLVDHQSDDQVNTNAQARSEKDNVTPAGDAASRVLSPGAGTVGGQGATSSAEANMFNGNNFEFANELDGADDIGGELIDFGDDDAMDDSAFGDALHGMDD